MRLLRPICIIVGFAILLLNTGDCINLAFAGAKDAECCMMQAECPFAGTGQMDSCCKTPAGPAKYIQAGSQQSISQPAVTYLDFPTTTFDGQLVKTTAYFSVDGEVHSPPGALNALNTPLLI